MSQNSSKNSKKLEIIKDVCTKCGADCCKMGGAEFTKKEMDKVISAGFPAHFRKISEDHFETATKDGVCAYLGKDSLCSIHSLRPKMCKGWPVHLDFKDGKKIYLLMECPLTPLLSKSDISKMKKQMSGYTEEVLFCNGTKMTPLETKKVVRKYEKYGMKIIGSE